MTETVRGAVATRKEDPKSVLVAKQYLGQFAEILPDHIEAKQFLGSALATIRKDPELFKAAENSPAAFVNALMECAQLGHAPGSKEFYLTPRWNGKAKKTEIVGMEGYRGVIERMYRSGAVASVKVREVCERDKFEYVEGVHDRPIHDVDWFCEGGRGDMIGVYAYAELVTGSVSRVVILSKADVEEVRKRSDLGKQDKGPWATDTRAMWWKTAAHRLEPWVPTSAEYRRESLRAAVEAENLRRESRTVDVDTGEIIDAEIVEPNQQGEGESS